MPGKPSEMPVTTYGSTSRLEVAWRAETVWTGAALSEAGEATEVMGAQDGGGAVTQRFKSPAVMAAEASYSASVVASAAMVATTLCTCWEERPSPSVSETCPWQKEAG